MTRAAHCRNCACSVRSGCREKVKGQPGTNHQDSYVVHLLGEQGNGLSADKPHKGSRVGTVRHVL